MAKINKILVVDDNEDILSIYRMVLERAEFTVELARSGDEALTKMKVFQPDLIFLDVMMPGRSGLEVLGILRSQEEYGAITTPIVMLTNIAESDTRQVADNRAADMYVIKANITNDELVDIAKSFERQSERAILQHFQL